MRIGYLFVWPITLALISRERAARGQRHDGRRLLSRDFLGGILSGWLGRFYEAMTPAQFWF